VTWAAWRVHEITRVKTNLQARISTRKRGSTAKSETIGAPSPNKRRKPSPTKSTIECYHRDIVGRDDEEVEAAADKYPTIKKGGIETHAASAETHPASALIKQTPGTKDEQIKRHVLDVYIKQEPPLEKEDGYETTQARSKKCSAGRESEAIPAAEVRQEFHAEQGMEQGHVL